MPLEIACFSLQSALIAEQGGADRVEFCRDYPSGGLTPGAHDVKKLREEVSIPIYVMIRLRGGSFVCTLAEIEQMKTDILMLKEYVDGFVFGVLLDNNEIDVKINTQLVHLAAPRPCTFHRAFDIVPRRNMMQALEDVINCGFATLLSSGGATTAMQGREIVAELVKAASGRITIMPGGGVRSGDVQVIVQDTRAEWVHSSAIVANGDEADHGEVTKLAQALHRSRR